MSKKQLHNPQVELRLVTGAIRGVKTGETLVFEREPDNPYDRNAVKVCSNDGRIGYVPRNVARLLAPVLDAGHNVQAVMGCGIRINFTWPKAAEQLIAEAETHDRLIFDRESRLLDRLV